jgi:hypothetical protein
MKRQFRYTDKQKQELFTFVKGEMTAGTPLKRIFKRVEARFPWYAAKSLTAFQIKKTIKLNKTWNKEAAKIKKLKVMKNPCTEISLDDALGVAVSPTSLVGFSQNSVCTVMHHQKLEEFIRLITGVANQALNELPVVMVSALKISHKDNAKFEKIKGIIAETAGCLDKLDDLVKCLEKLREVLGQPAQHP